MTFEKVQSIIAEQVNIAPEEIALTSTIEQLKIDSLDMVEVIMRIEEDFDITVDEELKVLTVADLVNYIDDQAK